MVMNLKKIKRIGLAVIALSVLSPVAVNAQLSGTNFAVGGACASYPQGATTMVADTDLDRQNIILICDGTVWQTLQPPSSINVDRMQDLDVDTFVDVDTGDDDVIRFNSLGREVSTVYSLGISDTFLTLQTPTAGSDTGIFFTENGTDTAYMGLGYGGSHLNFDAITGASSLVFRTQGYNNFTMLPSGDIGLGNVSSPAAALHSSAYVNANRLLNQVDTTSYVDISTQDRIRFYHDGGLAYLDFDGVNQRIGIGETGDANSPASINFTNRVYIDKVNSRVGINTTTPRATLDVNGAIKVGSNTDACDADLIGGIRWSAASTCIEVCDGVAWGCSLEASCGTDAPAVWTFLDQVDVATSTIIESNIEQITGIAGCEVEVTVYGDGSPEYRICDDILCSVVDLNWTSSDSTITNNKYVQVRNTSPATGGENQITNLRIGSVLRNWQISTAGSCADNFPPLGTLCADGTIYVGRTNDNFVKMYATRCDAPRTFDGTNCTGSASNFSWNNNTSNYTGAVGANSWFQGQANTTDLVNADVTTDAGAPYNAANYCDQLGDGAEPEAHGHTDWYLPSADEADQICGTLDGLGLDWTGTHWTSTETNSDRARYERNDCYSSHTTKANDYRVRCIRKESATGTDFTPNAFNFDDEVDVSLNTLITSSSIQIKGIDAAAPISVSGDGSPQISRNGGSTWSTTETVAVDGSVLVRLTSANADATTYSATVTIGGVNSTWNVTTADGTPDPYSFTDQTNIALGGLAISNIVTITSIDIPVSVSISGTGSPQFSINGGPFTTSGTINNGDTLQLRLIASGTASTTNTATVVVGNSNETWDVTSGSGAVAVNLTGTTPADDTTNVGVGSNLVMNFDVNVQAGSGNILIIDTTTGTDSRSIPIGDAQVSIVGNVLTVNPSTDLQLGKAYEITMASGVIEDLSANDFGGILPDEFNFTTTPITSLAQITGLSSGNYLVTANSQTFTGYVYNDLGSSWLLVGRGREGWEFDSNGQGTNADVISNLGLVAGFSPSAYSDAIINDLITNASIDLTGVEILIRRAADITGTNYQNVLWRPTAQTSWVWSFDTTDYQVVHEVQASVLGPGSTSTLTTRDAQPSNDQNRVFTWDWGSHASLKGFSYGSSISGVDGNDPNTFMWESGSENHAIPYTEVYIRVE